MSDRTCCCERPLELAARNGKGPVPSGECFWCGRWIVCRCDRPEPRGNVCARCGDQPEDRWRYPNTAHDPEVLAVWREEVSRRDGDSLGRNARGSKVQDRSRPVHTEPTFEKTTARYLTATHVNAQRFMAWLDREGIVLRQQHQKKAAEWKRGTRARIEIETTVDRILTGFGRHLSELPDEVFE